MVPKAPSQKIFAIVCYSEQFFYEIFFIHWFLTHLIKKYFLNFFKLEGWNRLQKKKNFVRYDYRGFLQNGEISFYHWSHINLKIRDKSQNLIFRGYRKNTNCQVITQELQKF